jgi:DNA modification methylase
MTLSWTNIQVRLGDLRAWSDNPRLSTKKQAERLLKSFDEFGQVQTIAVSPDLDVYDGHQRLSALLTIHGKDYIVDARQSSRALTDEERRKLVIYLHSGAVGSWDWDALSGWNAQEVIGWGMDDAVLKDWKRDVTALTNLIEAEKPPVEDVEPQIDRAEELREKWGVESGQLWQLGEHRLICGDCTDRAVVERVKDIPLNIMVTDPPYGVEYDANWRNEAAEKGLLSYAAIRVGQVENDNRDDWREAWELFDGDVLYCWHADRRASNVQESIESCGFEIRAQIIWAKKHFVIGRGHYTPRHEPCWYAVRKGKTAQFIGDKMQTTLWDDITLDRNAQGGHSTQKPVLCMCRPIQNHNGDVYDPFLGSGTTLIACENLGRKCRAIEISPAYVAVALQRWADLTGKTPELVTQVETG